MNHQSVTCLRNYQKIVWPVAVLDSEGAKQQVQTPRKKTRVDSFLWIDHDDGGVEQKRRTWEDLEQRRCTSMGTRRHGASGAFLCIILDPLLFPYSSLLY
jgi:hypothetical protein